MGNESVTRTVTRKSWIAEASGVSRGLAAVIAVAATIGSAGVVCAGVDDSPYWFLALLLTLPIGGLFALLAVRGRVAVPLGTTVSVGRDGDIPG